MSATTYMSRTSEAKKWAREGVSRFRIGTDLVQVGWTTNSVRNPWGLLYWKDKTGTFTKSLFLFLSTAFQSRLVKPAWLWLCHIHTFPEVRIRKETEMGLIQTELKRKWRKTAKITTGLKQVHYEHVRNNMFQANLQMYARQLRAILELGRETHRHGATG